MPSNLSGYMLSEFTLSIELEEFLNVFWMDSQWYQKFLVDKLLDIKVEIGPWNAESLEENAKFSSQQETPVLKRIVNSYHPSKITFPGLPSHAESVKTHTIERFSGPSEKKAIIKECNNFRGIPYSDYFSVNIEWIVTSQIGENKDFKVDSSSSRRKLNEEICHVCIFLSFAFHKSTWLQGTIESNTRAEMLSIYELWLDCANDYIRRSLDRKHSSSQSLAYSNSMNHFPLSNQLSTAALQLQTSSTSITGAPAGSHPTPLSQSSKAPSLAHSVSESALAPCDSSDRNFVNETIGLLRSNYADGYESSACPSDDETIFYDCEEGDKIHVKFSKFAATIGENSYTDLPLWVTDNSNHGGGENSTGSVAMDSLMRKGQVDASLLDIQGINHPSYTGGGANILYGQSTSRDIAVNIVETFFVLTQYSFWRIYQIYMYDLKELFNVESTQVISRIINSFLPGWHSPILLRPDVYGPLLAVFMLPQSLLLSMEISKVGCNPTSQLGNAVVVSLCLWIGLSIMYRLLAFVIAPPIGMKHCLSMTGYSFFSWNL
eukprot:gene27670-36420_t